ncbi:hypothetical protein Q7O_002691 [Pectobacterium carotovorum subsp. carotovorum PCCS1]|nr:hypothetical protein [Pectobacterium carotovorum subsp. carotovorum PCCS1]
MVAFHSPTWLSELGSVYHLANGEYDLWKVRVLSADTAHT